MPPKRRASRVSEEERETNRKLLATEAAILLLLLRAVKKRNRLEVMRALITGDRRARLLARERVAAELRVPVSRAKQPKTIRVVRRVDLGDGTFRETVSVHSASFRLGKREQARFKALAAKTVADANARDRAAKTAAAPKEARAAAQAATESHVRLIATTETMTSFSEERDRVARDLARETGSPRQKEWRATLDKRACERCERLHGMTVSVFAAFEQGEPPLHPRCRCWVLYS